MEVLDKMNLNDDALKLRNQLGEDANSLVDIFGLVDKIDKLTLVFFPLNNNISGYCFNNGKIKVIAINSCMSYGRQRFSLAHEFYHLFFDNSNKLSISNKELYSQDEVEKKANQFASYFLVPYGTLKSEVEKLKEKEKFSIEDVIYLEHVFGMSHKAMIYRLLDDKLISKNIYDEFNQLTNIISLSKKFGFDETLYLPRKEKVQRKTYGYYLQQVEQLKNLDLISEGKYEELLLQAFREDIVFNEDGEGIID